MSRVVLALVLLVALAHSAEALGTLKMYKIEVTDAELPSDLWSKMMNMLEGKLELELEIEMGSPPMVLATASSKEGKWRTEVHKALHARYDSAPQTVNVIVFDNDPIFDDELGAVDVHLAGMPNNGKPHCVGPLALEGAGKGNLHACFEYLEENVTPWEGDDVEVEPEEEEPEEEEEVKPRKDCVLFGEELRALGHDVKFASNAAEFKDVLAAFDEKALPNAPTRFADAFRAASLKTKDDVLAFVRAQLKEHGCEADVHPVQVQAPVEV